MIQIFLNCSPIHCLVFHPRCQESSEHCSIHIRPVMCEQSHHETITEAYHVFESQKAGT